MGNRRSIGKIYEITILKHNEAFPEHIIKVSVKDSGKRELVITYGQYKNVKLKFLDEKGDFISIADAPYISNKIMVSKAVIMNIEGINKKVQFPEKSISKSKSFKLNPKGNMQYHVNGTPIDKNKEIIIHLFTYSVETLLYHDNKYEFLRRSYENKSELKENKIKDLENLIELTIEDAKTDIKEERDYWKKLVKDLKNTIREQKKQLDLKEAKIINKLAGEAYETLNERARIEEIPEEGYTDASDGLSSL